MRPVPVEMSVEEDAAPMFAGVIRMVVADVIRPYASIVICGKFVSVP